MIRATWILLLGILIAICQISGIDNDDLFAPLPVKTSNGEPSVKLVSSDGVRYHIPLRITTHAGMLKSMFSGGMREYSQKEATLEQISSEELDHLIALLYAYDSATQKCSSNTKEYEKKLVTLIEKTLHDIQTSADIFAIIALAEYFLLNDIDCIYTWATNKLIHQLQNNTEFIEVIGSAARALHMIDESETPTTISCLQIEAYKNFGISIVGNNLALENVVDANPTFRFSRAFLAILDTRLSKFITAQCYNPVHVACNRDRSNVIRSACIWRNITDPKAVEVDLTGATSRLICLDGLEKLPSLLGEDTANIMGLYVCFNQLTTITNQDLMRIASFDQLTRLSFNCCNLTAVPVKLVSKLPCLQLLVLSNNEITLLPAGFIESNTLRYLSLANNQLKEFDDNIITHAPQLRGINLHGNQLTNTTCTARAFRTLCNTLEFIDLLNNNFTDSDDHTVKETFLQTSTTIEGTIDFELREKLEPILLISGKTNHRTRPFSITLCKKKCSELREDRQLVDRVIAECPLYRKLHEYNHPWRETILLNTYLKTAPNEHIAQLCAPKTSGTGSVPESTL